MEITTEKSTVCAQEALRFVARWEIGGQKITIASQIFFEDDPPMRKATMLERFAQQIIQHLDVHPTPGWRKNVAQPQLRE